MKVDVVCPSLQKLPDDWINRVNIAVPLNRLIVDGTKPVGMARYKLFTKVETDYFMSIDSDIYILSHCFNGLFPYMRDKKVGAVASKNRLEGFGKKFDDALNNSLKSESFRFLDETERAESLNCVLLRKEAIYGWSPSTSRLEVLEDEEIGKYIMNKGYKWIVVDIHASIHRKNWIRFVKGSFWAGRTEVHYLGSRQFLKRYIKRVLSVPYNGVRLLVTRNRLFVFNIIGNLFYVLGGLFSDYRNAEKNDCM